MLAYTCYATGTGSTTDIGYQLNSFLAWYTTNKIVTSTAADTGTGASTVHNLGILESYGFAPLPSPWVKAINATFVAQTTPFYISSPATIITTTAGKSKTVFTPNAACKGVAGA